MVTVNAWICSVQAGIRACCQSSTQDPSAQAASRFGIRVSVSIPVSMPVSILIPIRCPLPGRSAYAPITRSPVMVLGKLAAPDLLSWHLLTDGNSNILFEWGWALWHVSTRPAPQFRPPVVEPATARRVDACRMRTHRHTLSCLLSPVFRSRHPRLKPGCFSAAC